MDINKINIADFNYNLPEDKIAKHPLPNRDECKLLFNKDYAIEDYVFKELPALLPKESVLVYNTSKVINARIIFHKGENSDGARIEVFCLEPMVPFDYQLSFASKGECSWRCIVGNSRKWKDNTVLFKYLSIGGKELTLQATRHHLEDQTWKVVFKWDDKNVTFSQIIEAAGVIPIPPYLNRETEKEDHIDYQTVYARQEGSVAAPTAGLHFSEQTLNEIDKRTIARREVTLHVGAGTFKPVTAEYLGSHVMHHEFFSVDAEFIKELIEWKKGGKDHKEIIAVGTTTVRTLESLYFVGCLMHEGKWEGYVPQWYPYKKDLPCLTVTESLKEIVDNLSSGELKGETQILIAPGYIFRIIDAMITNFHQPGSTLLLLISAFTGRKDCNWEKWKEIYSHALKNDYRFLSYGDACFFV